MYRLGKPCFYLVSLEDGQFRNLYLRLVGSRKNAIVRVIRGQKSTTVQDLFNEVGAALQFPYYFGENWNAFSECITDLDWLEGDAYLLLVSKAKSLLCAADSEDFSILLRVLSDASLEWQKPNEYIPRNRAPTPFHVAFQCTASDIAEFRLRLAQAAAEFAEL